jgi:ribonuclease G
LKRSLIIQSSTQGLDIALLEDDGLVEFHQDVVNKEFLIGDVYLGKVKKIIPGLNAAFVDIGYGKNSFLHYHDLGQHFLNLNEFTKFAFQNRIFPGNETRNFNQPNLRKNGEIKEILKPDQQLVVQIIKEPISTKGHRISCDISLAGRYLVLIPFGRDISVSKRIRDNRERKRLVNIFREILPRNFGLIVRTAAEGKQIRTLENDLTNNYDRWNTLVSNLVEKQQKLLGEYSKTTSLLRDLLNDTFDAIVVNDRDTYNQIFAYLNSISSEQKKILKFYKDKTPPFEIYNVDRQIKSLFGRIINVGKGAYIVIDKTEAMHVFDVNSGSKLSKDNEREENVLNINMDSAAEVARQLRLRDFGGLIIVDFIDMKVSESRRIVFERMKELMKTDKAQHSILPISRFGLMEITRERIKPAIELSISETCPVCKGSGEVRPTILITDEIEFSLNNIRNELKEKNVVLRVHPFMKSHLTHGFPSLRIQWILKFRMWITISASQSLNLIQYQILNKEGKDLEEFEVNP